MNPQLRAFFDQHVAAVVAELPPLAKQILEEVPMYVEDFPSARVMRQMGIRHRSGLLGLYSGIPVTERTLEAPAVATPVIYLYREGLLSLASRGGNRYDTKHLQQQIRDTILHELGHHHGLDEDDLEQLGY